MKGFTPIGMLMMLIGGLLVITPYLNMSNIPLSVIISPKVEIQRCFPELCVEKNLNTGHYEVSDKQATCESNSVYDRSRGWCVIGLPQWSGNLDNFNEEVLELPYPVTSCKKDRASTWDAQLSEDGCSLKAKPLAQSSEWGLVVCKITNTDQNYCSNIQSATNETIEEESQTQESSPQEEVIFVEDSISEVSPLDSEIVSEEEDGVTSAFSPSQTLGGLLILGGFFI